MDHTSNPPGFFAIRTEVVFAPPAPSSDSESVLEDTAVAPPLVRMDCINPQLLHMYAIEIIIDTCMYVCHTFVFGVRKGLTIEFQVYPFSWC